MNQMDKEFHWTMFLITAAIAALPWLGHAEDYFRIEPNGTYTKVSSKVDVLKSLLNKSDQRFVRCDEIELTNKATLRKK